MKAKNAAFFALTALLLLGLLMGCAAPKPAPPRDLPPLESGENSRDPAVLEAYGEAAVAALQECLRYDSQDEVRHFPDGTLESVQIHRQETAEQLFSCIRGAVNVVNVTGLSVKPEELPLCIQEQNQGSYDHFYVVLPQTEQQISFVFSEEDASALQELIQSLPASS